MATSQSLASPEVQRLFSGSKTPPPAASVLPSGLKATHGTKPAVDAQGQLLLAGGRVPQSHRLVVAGGRQQLAVGRSGHGSQRPEVALERRDRGLLAGGDGLDSKATRSSPAVANVLPPAAKARPVINRRCPCHEARSRTLGRSGRADLRRAPAVPALQDRDRRSRWPLSSRRG